MAIRKEAGKPGWRELGGIVLAAACLMVFLSLFSYQPNDIPLLRDPPNRPPATPFGLAGAWTAFGLFMSLGVTAHLLPIGLLFVAGCMLFQREGRVWPRAAWLVLVLVSIACLVELRPAWYAGAVERLNIATAGGMIGYGLGRCTLAWLFGEAGAIILACACLAAGLVFLFRISPYVAGRWIAAQAKAGWAMYVQWRKSRMDRQQAIAQEQKELARKRQRLEDAMRAQREANEAERRAAAQAAPVPAPVAPAPVPAPVRAVEARPEPKPEPPEPPPELKPEPPRPKPPRVEKPKPAPEPPPPEAALPAPADGATAWKLPPMSLLDPLPPASQREIRDDLQKAQQTLVETLADFGIEATITNVETGPVVTRYELLPAAGVRVEKIVGLGNNIALSMRAESVRVQAPVPGKGVVGIEVPNPKTAVVYAREILESDAWRGCRAALPLAIGKDVGGRVIVADLAEMPHLLIAGATGSGKTVCMNSLLAGLLLTRTPDQLRLMLVDPKIVEFAALRELPHLVVPVITDAKKVALGLRWAITEMETRYKLFARAGVRNIKAFNSRPIVKQPDLFGDAGAPPEEQRIPDRVPYIVIVIDELADLMLVARQDIENSITRLAQLSRAVGIHMILATQRPSVNVITGTIKANFPARIAFQVAQKTDSRTILDAIGADKLLGKGDMLFLPPGIGRLTRAQGCLTSDREVHAIADFLREQGQPRYEVAIKEKLEKKGGDVPDMEEDEDIIQQSLEIIRQTRRASTSSLQRRLRIGYTRAARIMDLLEQRGVVGPAQGSDPREILIDLDGEIPQNDGAGGDEGPPAGPEDGN